MYKSFYLQEIRTSKNFPQKAAQLSDWVSQLGMVFPLPNQSVDDVPLVQNHWNGQARADGLEKKSLGGLKN